MFYRNELSFLCEVFKKNRLNTQVLDLASFKNLLENDGGKEALDYPSMFSDILSSLEPNTVYRLTDPLERCYRLLLLPDTDTPTVLCVGPFLSERVSSERMLEIGERLGVSPHKQHLLAELYGTLPILTPDSLLFSVFNTFCERMWKTPAFNLREVTKKQLSADAPISRSMRDLTSNDTLLSIKTMEQRYAYENEMIRAVFLGQPYMETKFKAAFSSDMFEKRVADPLRNAKNYIIIMNTLLRKAAEQGGVHPLHLDQVSSDFARKIEELPSLSERATLMGEMFHTYSRLVRNHALKKFSPLVQKSILIIDADLSADLSPGALAKNQSVSLGYLSTIFKKETKQTISAYIRKKRMEYAAYLLRTTALQIQSVALHCGIMDVQYFSKLFKAHHKKRPRNTEKAQSRQKHKKSLKIKDFFGIIAVILYNITMLCADVQKRLWERSQPERA